MVLLSYRPVARLTGAPLLAALLLGAAVACGPQQRIGPPGHVCPSTSFSPGLVPGSVPAGEPVFFVSGPEECQDHAYTYEGRRTDRRLIEPSCVEACGMVSVAPDGWVPPDELAWGAGLSGWTWAADSRRVCGISASGHGSVTLGWADLHGPGTRHELRIPGISAGFTMPSMAVAACDIAADTAVLKAVGADEEVTALAVVSLSRPKVRWERRFSPDERGPTVGPVSVVAAPDGRYLAVRHTRYRPWSAPPPGTASCAPGARVCEVSPAPAMPQPVPTVAELYALHPVPHVIGRVSGRAVVGWSGDGSRLVTATASTVQVSEVPDGRVIWQTAGSSAQIASAPGQAAMAVQTSGGITVLDAAGHTVRLPGTGHLLP
jgi:hypothetical protein